MAMVGAIPEMWSEKAKISISVEGGSEKAFEAETETIDIDVGDKDFDVIATLKGGRLVKYNPQEPTSFTMEAYPLQAGTSGAAGTGFFDLVNSPDAAQPLVINVDLNRYRYRMAVLWTNDTANTGAASTVNTIITANVLGLRAVGCGFFISAKPSFTDGALKFTVVFKCPPFKKDATANVKVESTDGTVELAALAAFTTTTNW